MHAFDVRKHRLHKQKPNMPNLWFIYRANDVNQRIILSSIASRYRDCPAQRSEAMMRLLSVKRVSGIAYFLMTQSPSMLTATIWSLATFICTVRADSSGLVLPWASVSTAITSWPSSLFSRSAYSNLPGCSILFLTTVYSTKPTTSTSHEHARSRLLQCPQWRRSRKSSAARCLTRSTAFDRERPQVRDRPRSFVLVRIWLLNARK